MLVYAWQRGSRQQGKWCVLGTWQQADDGVCVALRQPAGWCMDGAEAAAAGLAVHALCGIGTEAAAAGEVVLCMASKALKQPQQGQVVHGTDAAPRQLCVRGTEAAAGKQVARV